MHRQNRKETIIHARRTKQIECAKTYIKNLSKLTLTNDEILVLSKNLKFSPTPSPPSTRDLMNDFDDLARRMRTRLWAHDNNKKRKLEPFTEQVKRCTDTPSTNASLENYLTATKIELANLHSRKRLNEKSMLKQALERISTNKRF